MREEKICPQCGSPLHAVRADEGWRKMPTLWCMACSYQGYGRAGVLSPAEGRWSERNFSRRDFTKLMERYYEDGIDLSEAFLQARATPGRWVASTQTTVLSPGQILRALVGLSWTLKEKYMAVKYRLSDDSVDLALDADKVVPAGSIRPRWHQLVWGILTNVRIVVADPEGDRRYTDPLC